MHCVEMQSCYLAAFQDTRGTISSCSLPAAPNELCGCVPNVSLTPLICKVWRNFMGDVVVCKPMTDLCETCQRNSAAIVRSFNKSEEDKSEV